MKPGESTFLVKLDAPAVGPGNIDVRVRLSPAEGSALPLSEGRAFDSERRERSPCCSGGARPPARGSCRRPSPLFSRTERMRLDFPVGPAGDKPGTGRVLDRGGTATQMTVVGRRADGRSDGAALDYSGLEPRGAEPRRLRRRGGVRAKDAGEERVLTPIRVVR